MYNIGTKLPRKIDLVQIEKGVEIYNTLLELKEIINDLQNANQYIINSEHIYLESVLGTNKKKLKIHDSWQKKFREDIFNDLVSGKITGIETIEDILVKLNNLDKNFNTVNNIVNDIEKIVEKVCEERAFNIVQNELERLEDSIEKHIDVVKEDILKELYASFNKNINDVNMRIGDLSGLHPYIGEALGENNKTVKDAINFLFQLIVDLNENVALVNSKHGDNRAQLINSYNKNVPDPEPVKVPYPFVIPQELGFIEGTNISDTLTEAQRTLHELQQLEDSVPEYDNSLSDEEQANENMNLMSIADQIKYRKTLNRIIDNGWEDEE